MPIRKRTAALAAITLTASLYAYNTLTPSQGAHNAFRYTESAPLTAPAYVDYQAVIDALSTEAQIVGATGQAQKTVRHVSEKWYGDRAVELTLKGEFKLGIQTKSIEVTTHGNTIKVRFPQPELISADFPFDHATIGKSVGILRKNLTDGELQALYGKAREGAIADIKADEEAHRQAVVGVERAIDGLLGAVENVGEIEYEVETEESE
ncbi:MAG: DUF4230 domain-containing protein [Bacillota bacterium]